MLPREEMKKLLVAHLETALGRLQRRRLKDHQLAYRLHLSLAGFFHDMRAASHLDLPWYPKTLNPEELAGLVRMSVDGDGQVHADVGPALERIYPDGKNVDPMDLTKTVKKYAPTALGGGRFVDLD